MLFKYYSLSSDKGSTCSTRICKRVISNLKDEDEEAVDNPDSSISGSAVLHIEDAVDEEEKNRQKRNNRLKSKVWKYFAGNATSTDGATCNVCQNCYKTSGNTSNLTEHLLRKHRVEYIKSSDVDSNDKNKGGDQCKIPVFLQETIRSILKQKNPYSNTHPKKKYQDKLLRLITTRNLPFSLIDYKEFMKCVSKELGVQ